MREILFRGKRTDNNKWVEGSYIHNIVGDKHYICSAMSWRKELWDHYEVIPETVGMFMGVKDMNGSKVFEGDILSDGKGDNGVVKYCAPQFCGVTKNDEGEEEIFQLCEGKVNFTQMTYTQVIGNIHDNPELLTR